MSDKEAKDSGASKDEEHDKDASEATSMKDDSPEEAATQPQNTFLQNFALAPAQQRSNFPNRKGRKDTYAFWSSQPVTQFEEVAKVSTVRSSS